MLEMPSSLTDSEVGERMNSGILPGDPDERSATSSKVINGHTWHSSKPPDLPGVWRRRSQEGVNVLGFHLVGGALRRDRTGDWSARGTCVARGANDLDRCILFTETICIVLYNRVSGNGCGDQKATHQVRVTPSISTWFFHQ